MSTQVSLVTLFVTVVLSWSLSGEVLAASKGDREYRAGSAASSSDRRARKSRKPASRRDDRGDRRQDSRQDSRQDQRDDRAGHYWKYRLGLRLLTLPARHRQIVIGSAIYFYADGVYFVK